MRSNGRKQGALCHFVQVGSVRRDLQASLSEHIERVPDDAQERWTFNRSASLQMFLGSPRNISQAIGLKGILPVVSLTRERFRHKVFLLTICQYHRDPVSRQLILFGF